MLPPVIVVPTARRRYKVCSVKHWLQPGWGCGWWEARCGGWARAPGGGGPWSRGRAAATRRTGWCSARWGQLVTPGQQCVMLTARAHTPACSPSPGPGCPSSTSGTPRRPWRYSRRGKYLDTGRKYLVVLQVEAAEARRLALMPSMVVQTEPRLYTYILPPIRYPDGRHYLKLGQHDLSKVRSCNDFLT